MGFLLMQKGKVLELIRQKSSVNGNPRYILVIQNEQGHIDSVYTKPDSSFGYSATNYRDKVVSYETCIYRNKLSLSHIEEA